MKNKTKILKVKIQYKNDEESRNKLIEHILDYITDIKKNEGIKDGHK